ncbi:MAG: hypothetical protein ACREAB_13700 [Blastocatellia bacterium]
MVIVAAAFVLCPCLTIRSSAQTVSEFLWDVETEQTRIRDSLPAAASANRIKRIDGGILNLDFAVAAALREIKLREIKLREAGAPENDLSSTSTAVPGDGEEESGSGAEPNDPPDSFQPLPDHAPDQHLREGQKRDTFDWDSAFRQSMLFLGIQHAFRLATEAGTRAELKGPFFKDYFRALGNLRGWSDGDPFLVNYIGHPMMGSVTGFIQVQNDPRGIKEEVSLKKSYWRSRLKAFGWSFAYSTQFELGLFGEAGIGNIGIRPYGKAKNPMGYVDLVVTPVVGTGWLVGEDMIDRYLIQRIENCIRNRLAQIVIRGFLNPTRSFANLIRGKKPWYRDNRE